MRRILALLDVATDALIDSYFVALVLVAVAGLVLGIAVAIASVL